MSLVNNPINPLEEHPWAHLLYLYLKCTYYSIFRKEKEVFVLTSIAEYDPSVAAVPFLLLHLH